MTPQPNLPVKELYIGAISFMVVFIIFLLFIIREQATVIDQSTIWLNETENEIDELETRADEMRNLCNIYLQEEWSLMDMGNDQSS
jgi:hypothetical protein